MKELKNQNESKEFYRNEPLGYEWPGAYFIGEEELELVTKVIKAQSPFRHYGLGCQNMCATFEKEFAEYCNIPYASAVSSGTAALSVALSALGIGPGQEVIVSGYMWISTIAAIVGRGAIPVLCGIDETFCIDPKDLEKKITPKTTLVLTANMSGTGGNIEQICEIAHRHKLKVLEDCAQAGGASYKGKKFGTFGDIGIFSFQYNKAMTTGEGGMLVMSDELLYKRSQAAQDIGHSRNLTGRLEVNPDVLLWGLGARMSELQGAFGLAQLRKLDKITNVMRSAKYRIRSALSEIEGLRFRKVDDPEGDNGSFLITIYPTAEAAREMARELTEMGIRGGENSSHLCHFENWGFHLYYNLPALVKKASTSPDGFPWTHPLNKDSVYDYDKGSLPQTDELFSKTVIQAIPSNISEQDVNDIIEAYQIAAKKILR